jgi:hypothetical protein
MPEVLDEPIEVFYPGTHTDFRRKVVTVGRSDIANTVSWFNSSGGRIPIVVAHPGSEDDNFGFATKLGIQGNRMVVTEVDKLDRSFKAIVNSGELPKVSVKLRLPGHPSNKSDGYELQHIGFFGKSRVALDRLKEASFSEFNDKEFYFNCMDKKKTAAYMDDEDMDDEDMDEMTPEEKAAAKKKKMAKTAEMAAHEAEVAAFQKEKAAFKRAREIEPVVEEWVREGKITPASKSGLVAVFAALPEDLEVSFSDSEGEESTQTAAEFLAEFLKSLPQTIVYGEVSGMKAKDKKVLTAAFSFNGEDVDDGVVDTPSVDILNQLAADGIDFTDTAAFSQALKKYQGGK